MERQQPWSAADTDTKRIEQQTTTINSFTSSNVIEIRGNEYSFRRKRQPWETDGCGEFQRGTTKRIPRTPSSSMEVPFEGAFCHGEEGGVASDVGWEIHIAIVEMQ
jgi:hypothetical protein